MKRVIFDTNVYGHLVDEPDYPDLEKSILSDRDFIVYGYTYIRKELRKIPIKTEFSKKVRTMLLVLYDSITKGRVLPHLTDFETLAKSYHSAYKECGGTYSWDTSIKVDFMLVACASVNCLDIVYSADRKTMISTYALKAYKTVNEKRQLNTPTFVDYKKLVDDFRSRRPAYRLLKKP